MGLNDLIRNLTRHSPDENAGKEKTSSKLPEYCAEDTELFMYKELKLEREFSYQDIETGEELPENVKRKWFKIIDYQPRSKKYVAQTLYVVNGRYYKVALESDTVKVKLGKPEK